MTGPKKRTVHFFDPVRVMPDGTEVELQTGFWKELHSKVSALESDEQFTTIRGIQYRGAARHCLFTSVDYLYLGKTRETIDYPDSSVGDDDEQPLVLEDGGRLVEPCYLYCVRKPYNAVATLRASGGATISAVETWITRVLRDDLGSDAIELRPVVRNDQMERLAQAESVAKFSVKLDKDRHPADSNGTISGAIKDAYESLGTGATMTFEWSYGNSTPTHGAGVKMVDQIRQVLRWNAAKSAEATVLRTDEGGNVVRDQIDFFKDRVSYRVPVGESSEIVQTADVVTAALREASRIYLQNNLPIQ
ncbi:hypothetical protein IU421_04920 [Nocardia cyriacigeorgica]|uniref:hypothetical protein n=1 Tax=Nocardia cyriacigeorgica TaxID=135487 RepID=UPI0018957CF8|nr:hypothetical protein [Nocardia cyriacigeorgica]MBF6158973.1 hypothetical protein [Nocardia cyriacigeorgica]MBF6197341.1 hypothetical protein [Nocardia cyriacigeorgica]MBF6513623.1 hypothetical protein [Nocardia cyriacigeorgica]